MVKKQLRRDLANKGMDPDLLNDPLAVVKDQPGSNLTEVLPELFEKGLRYCLDSLVDPSDWRRKTYETCYECTTLKLTSVCMSCARHCLFAQKLRPYIRRRSVGNNLCDCILSGVQLSLPSIVSQMSVSFFCWSVRAVPVLLLPIKRFV